MQKLPIPVWALLVLSGLALWLPGLGSYPLFDWDTINFAECAREMLETGDFLRVQISFRPFFEKPPLFFWLQAGSMALLGVNDFAAQLPNVLAGIATLLLVWQIGKRHFSERLGLVWAMGFAGSMLPTFYFRHGFIDPVFNLFIFLSLYNIILYHWKRNGLAPLPTMSCLVYLLWAGVWMGLGILTKGPVAVLLPGLAMAVYWALNRFRLYISVPHTMLYLATGVAVVGAWVVAIWVLHGARFFEEFWAYSLRLLQEEDAGHGGFPGYHVVILLVGCFPASIFALRMLWRDPNPENPQQADFRKWMLLLAAVVLVVFSLVRTKIAHYSSLAYFPVTFLAALGIERIMEGRTRLAKWQHGGIIAFGGLCAGVLMAVPFVGMDIDAIVPYITDPFARLNLQADVAWHPAEALVGLLLAGGVLVFGVLWRRGMPQRALLALFGAMGGTIAIGSVVFVPKVLAYTQGAPVEFFRGLQGKAVYVHSLNYKSYAPAYYARLQPPTNPEYYTAPDLKTWLLEGPVDRDVYFSAKLPNIDEWRNRPDLVLLYEKNGFAFFKRNAMSNPHLNPN